MIRDGKPFPRYFIVTYQTHGEPITKLFKVMKGREITHKFALINYLIRCNLAILYLEEITESVGYDDSKYEFVEVRGE